MIQQPYMIQMIEEIHLYMGLPFMDTIALLNTSLTTEPTSMKSKIVFLISATLWTD